jgi:hypothetical protein
MKNTPRTLGVKLIVDHNPSLYIVGIFGKNIFKMYTNTKILMLTNL